MDIAMTLPIPDTLSRLEKRLTDELVDEAWQWGHTPQALSRWEDEHLLDNPTPDLLAQHKKAIEHALAFGRWLSLATSHPGFPDRETKEMVEATLWVLQGMFDHFHKPSMMTKEQADHILAQVFPDES